MAAKELLLSPQLHCERLREKLFLPALAAHRLAQGGGSGLDVACSCFGGTLAFYLGEHEPKIAPVRLPRGLTVEVWSSLVESSTKGLLARVRALRQNNAIQYRTAMDAQARAAEAALSACRADDASGFLAALDAQRRALSTLGSAASAPIVTAEVENLAQKAEKLGAVVLPSGAGGGDIAIYVGFAPSHDLDAELCAQKHERLAGQLGADGVRRFD
jgi:phosphomevalonate kinase